MSAYPPALWYGAASQTHRACSSARLPNRDPGHPLQWRVRTLVLDVLDTLVRLWFPVSGMRTLAITSLAFRCYPLSASFRSSIIAAGVIIRVDLCCFREEFLVAGHEKLGLAGFSQREQVGVLWVQRDRALRNSATSLAGRSSVRDFAPAWPNCSPLAFVTPLFLTGTCPSLQ